jgi:hypothetical protein
MAQGNRMRIKKKRKSKNLKKPVQNREIQKIGPEFPSGSFNDIHSEITEDIVYFLRSFPDAIRSPQTATETLVKAALPTEKIAMEPEFNDISGDPISCTSIYSKTISKMEVNWKSFGDLPPQLASSIRSQIIEETIRQFLDESLRIEILEGLNRYRLRKKQAGERLEAGIAAALQLVLKDEKNNLIWPKIGLLHGIIHNSIALGLEIKNIYKDILDKNTEGISDDGLLLLDDQKKNEIMKKASLKLDENSRLNNFINRHTKKIYDEGIKAVLEGKLLFGFLTTDDLNKVSEYIIRAIGISGREQLNNANGLLSGLTAKKQKRLIIDMEIFIKETFTPEKMEKIRQKLHSILKDPEYLKPWKPFIFMMRNLLLNEDAPDRQKYFFFCTILGELAAFQKKSPNSETTGGGSK